SCRFEGALTMSKPHALGDSGPFGRRTVGDNLKGRSNSYHGGSALPDYSDLPPVSSRARHWWKRHYHEERGLAEERASGRSRQEIAAGAGSTPDAEKEAGAGAGPRLPEARGGRDER